MSKKNSAFAGLIICNHTLNDSFGSMYFGLALTTTSDIFKGTIKKLCYLINT